MVPPAQADVCMTYKASSIGYLTNKLRRKLLEAARLGPVTRYDKPAAHLDIVYPSRRTALRARNNRCAGDIHRTNPTYQGEGWHILNRGLKDLELGLPLSHEKLIRFAWRCRDDEEQAAWLYVGSHNLSTPAWERGYECGVVLPLKGNGTDSMRLEVSQVYRDLGRNSERYTVDLMWDN